MDCHESCFMISVYLSFAGEESVIGPSVVPEYSLVVRVTAEVFQDIVCCNCPGKRVFTIYPGEVLEDDVLAAVHLDGKEFAVQFANTRCCTVAEVLHPNNTHSYTLRVPSDHPVVMKVQSLQEVGTF